MCRQSDLLRQSLMDVHLVSQRQHQKDELIHHQVPSVASSLTGIMWGPYLSALVFFALVQYTVDNFSSVKRRLSSHTQFPLGCSLRVL